MRRTCRWSSRAAAIDTRDQPPSQPPARNLPCACVGARKPNSDGDAGATIVYRRPQTVGVERPRRSVTNL